MSHAIDSGPVPAPRGLEREEPELAQEDDIPSDDDHASPDTRSPGPRADGSTETREP